MNMKSKNLEWDKVSRQWDKETGDKGVWHQQHDINPVITRILGNIKGKTILEIGCGNGYFARFLAKKGAVVTAIDASAKMVGLATEREKKEHLGIKYLVRDAADLRNLKNSKFDVAVANMVFMDITDARRAIKEISRILKNNGKFIFSLTHPAFCDFQHWTTFKKEGKKYFARVIYRYLTSTAKKGTLSVGGINTTITQHHRSIDTYCKYLREASFLIGELEEIAASKPITKGNKKYKNVVMQRSKYFTVSEKKIKEFARKELPLFLVIGALKFK